MSSSAVRTSAPARNTRAAVSRGRNTNEVSPARDPSSPRVQTPDVPDHDGPEQPTLEMMDSIPPRSHQPDDSQPTVEGDDPPPEAIARELAELRAWRLIEKDRHELRKLRELKRKVQQGDLSALDEDLDRPQPPPREYGYSNMGAPRPKDPEVFSNRDRQQYNCWVRDCEGIFRGAPRTFETPVQKADFGARFLDETMRTIWETYCSDELRKDPSWSPNWDQMKAVMLDCLGPEAVRRLSAHNALKRIKQRQDQDPNQLLSKLTTLWSELGSQISEEQRKMDFLGALLPDIQKELLLRDPDDFPTVSTLNTLARYLWNKNRKSNTHPDQPGAKTETAPKPTTESRWGPSGTRKKPRRSAAAPADRKPPKTDHNGPKETNVICWGCNQPGHYKNECPKSKDTPKSSSAHKPGKDSGRKT